MMNVLEMLEQRMDRIKELMDAAGMSMEELMAESATLHVGCNRCPIKTACDQYRYHERIACSAVWAMYLKGELNKDA